MAKRTGGFRRKTKHKMSKNYRDKGKISLANYLQEFNAGDRVCLVADPSVHAGMYHPRFYGKSGTIVAKRGGCYEVQIKDVRMNKTLLVHPVHMKRA